MSRVSIRHLKGINQVRKGKPLQLDLRGGGLVTHALYRHDTDNGIVRILHCSDNPLPSGHLKVLAPGQYGWTMVAVSQEELKCQRLAPRIIDHDVKQSF